MSENRRICSFTEADGTAPVLNFVRCLDCKLQKKIYEQLKRLEDPQICLQPPHIKAFKQSKYKGFFELRTRIRQAVRIIFIFDSEGNIVLLHGFVKKNDCVTERALEAARVRQLALASGLAEIKDFNIKYTEEF